jgi:TonB family protein
MNRSCFKVRSNRLRRARVWLMQAAALALVAVLSMPAGAVDERAVKSRVAPTYPEVAKRMRITGEVRLSVTVDAEGNVTDVKEVSGNHMLSVAAEAAVRRWKFEPGPGPSMVIVEINFAL